MPPAGRVVNHHHLAKLTANLALLDESTQEPAKRLIDGRGRPSRLAQALEQVHHQERCLNLEQRPGP